MQNSEFAIGMFAGLLLQFPNLFGIVVADLQNLFLFYGKRRD